jgi:hypothetical protein
MTTRPPVIKTCPKCRRTFTAAQWAALPIGYELRDDVELLDVRHCPPPCNSTIAVVVETYRIDSETYDHPFFGEATVSL